jgi:hypothetical protein
MYGATTFFPVAMIGFAVTSFFVSFAWMEPLYIMAALSTGLYVSLREHAKLQNGGGFQSPSASQLASRGRGGWRVSGSAGRMQALGAVDLSTESRPCAAS